MKRTKKLHSIKQIKLFFVLTLFAILAVLVISSTSWAATYYVDATNGNDSNTGTSEAAPWKTIAKVNSSYFQPGDSILFKRDEMWQESLIIPSSGTNDKYITFTAYGMGQKPVIDGEYARNYCVNFESRDYVILSNMHIKRARRSNIVIWNGGTYNIIENVESEYGGVHGIELTDPNCHHNTVRNSETHHNGNNNYGSGIMITDSCHSNTIENVVSHHNAEDGISIGGDEFAGEAHVGGPNNIIKGCELYNNYEDGIDMKQGPQIVEHNICWGNEKNGINAWDYAEYVVIRYNSIFSNKGIGIRIGGTDISRSSSNDGYKIYYNLVHNNGAYGILAGGGVKGMEMYNNVFYHNNGQYGDNRYAGENLKAKNNIFVTNNSYYCFRVENYGLKNTMELDNNIFDNNDPIYTEDALRDADSGRTYTEADIDNETLFSETGWEKSGIAGDPKFTDPSNQDFSIQANSPCINAGTDVSLTQDFDGNPVPQGISFEIGAYEYQNSSFISPPQNFRFLSMFHFSSINVIL